MQEIIQKIKQGVGSLTVISEALEILKRTIKEDDPLYHHSLRIGLSLQKMGADEKTIACGFLQHVPKHRLSFKNLPEHTKEEIVVILKKANQLRELCSLPKTTKPKPLKNWQKVFLNQQAENLRRMFFAITHDIRPIFITLVDWLDAIRHLAPAYQKDEQTRKSIVALEILAPLAYGIGMGEIKGQLEDATFPYLYPKEYNWVLENLKEKYIEREKHAERVKPRLMKILTDKGIEVLSIDARAKHYFSLYQKLLRHNMDIEKIYDLVALRIIVPDVERCYRVLGAIHNVWEPLPDRIKDYISSPKSTGYRSLHTSVVCQENKIIEIQIKTPRMHKEAEYGAVAHFGYKEKIFSKTYKHQFYWLEQLRRWREEIKEPEKISEYLQSELFKDKVFVLTPMGDVISLPKDSTSVDFAYAVHTEVGDHCQGAKINNKMVALKQSLKTGDTVEIIIDKNKTPAADWLRFVKTHKAKVKIRSFLEKAQGISFAKPGKVNALKEKVALIKKILPAIRRQKGTQVLIGGESGISVKLSKCCSPKPGDVILAFITKGEGASVHKIECPSLRELQQKWPQRIIKASWKS